jgi:hypothetical protein
MAMPLAFSACQELQLKVPEQPELLPAYLADEERVVKALLDPSQLVHLGPGSWRYTVTRLQVFQLQIQPVVELRCLMEPRVITLEASDCQLEGLGIVDDFQLTLHSRLCAGHQGLEGDASLEVRVSQPPLLKLIPQKILEATGRSLLAGILLGIRTRVSHQLVDDFRDWCHQR